ncbi:MAG: class I SAM-dependent methyltransferase [Hyphomicrobiaceae bacterium]
MSSGAKSSLKQRAKSLLLDTAPGRAAMVLPRAVMAFKAARIAPQLGAVTRWAFASRERVNFTYDTTRDSQLLLCATVAEVAKCDARNIVAHLDELLSDAELIAHVEADNRAARHRVDPGFRPGRRLAFYLLVRALKPRFVVEAGVDRGLGALLISRALALNAAAGHAGDYLGIEFDGEKPIPLFEAYAGRIGHIERGDSVAILSGLDRPIDLFIHDTTTHDAHVTAQLAALQPKLSPHGVIASTWTTRHFIDFAFANDFGLLTHQEQTVDHWFQGDRVAMLFPRKPRPANGNSLWPRLQPRTL